MSNSEMAALILRAVRNTLYRFGILSSTTMCLAVLTGVLTVDGLPPIMHSEDLQLKGLACVTLGFIISEIYIAAEKINKVE